MSSFHAVIVGLAQVETLERGLAIATVNGSAYDV
jgi:hypothetical protein